jgi:P21-Rho-binding domain
MKGDEELYGWQDDIYSRSPLSGVSNPTNFVHKVHVGFDPISGAFTVRRSQAFSSLAYEWHTGHARTMEQVAHPVCDNTRGLSAQSASCT